MCTHSLKKVNLANNMLTGLPEELSNLFHLEYLNVNTNQLTKIPDSLIFLVGFVPFSLLPSVSLFDTDRLFFCLQVCASWISPRTCSRHCLRNSQTCPTSKSSC